ncbi:hypothetical protein MKC71_13985 [[Clostridium] innocuum]|nr:hypothetical protein [[Clostridium] innocuum]
MRLTYEQLSMASYSIVYDEAEDEDLEEVEDLLEYLSHNKDNSVTVL